MINIDYDLFLNKMKESFDFSKCNNNENPTLRMLGVDSLLIIDLEMFLEDYFGFDIKLKNLDRETTIFELFNQIVDQMRNDNLIHYPKYGYRHFETITEFFYQVTSEYSYKTAFHHHDDGNVCSVTYKKFQSDVNKLVSEFSSLVGRENKISLIGDNSYEWICYYFAIVISGNIAVLIDPSLEESEILNIINASDSIAVVLDMNRSKSKLSDKLSETSKFIVDISMYKRKIEYNNEVSSFFYTKSSDDATMIFTSGTTGHSKGVVLTHGNIMANLISICKYLLFNGKSIVSLPLHHTFGLQISLFSSLYNGGEILLSQGIDELYNEIKYFKPRHLSLVPLLIEKIQKSINQELSKKSTIHDKSHVLLENLEFICSGGAPVNRESVNFFGEIGVEIINGYGTTECSPVISLNRRGSKYPLSVGEIIDCNDVRIKSKKNNEVGEIQVKGENVMSGYYNLESSIYFSDGHYCTGDIGYLEDNHLFITGREKNMILGKNGINIYPEELETKLLTINEIEEVIVYQKNESIVAEVYAETNMNKSKVKGLLHDFNYNQPAHKRIDQFIFRNEKFERTSTNKIVR